MATLTDQLETFWASGPPDDAVRSIQDRLDEFWAQLPADARYTPEEWSAMEAAWLGQDSEPDACPEHKAGCPQEARRC